MSEKLSKSINTMKHITSKFKIYDWMLEELSNNPKEYQDSAGEYNCTKLAENCADALDLCADDFDATIPDYVFEEAFRVVNQVEGKA